jgi:CRISPR-associated protein Cas5h
MKAIQFQISGRWGHFRKAETNNNPLTHDFMTKTALVGMMGAVVGIEREEMRTYFPKMCDGLLYGVQVLGRVRKQSWGFTFRQASDVYMHAPRYMEILCHPSFSIVIACKDNIDDLGKHFFEQFCHSIKNEKAHFTPVLGLHNCPADILFESLGDVSEAQNGNFDTTGFISKTHKTDLKNSSIVRLGFEKIPTFQTDDFWNLPERYETVIYSSPMDATPNQTIRASGDFFTYQTPNNATFWHLI